MSVRVPYVRSLDGARGLAVAAVVAYHLRPQWVPGGFLGVDVFFVLSGYLITSLLLVEQDDAGRIGLGSFYLRRLRRLGPALLVVVAAVLVHAHLTAEPAEIDQAQRHAIGALGYVANWLFIFDGDSYFVDFVRPSPLRHVWSLAIEEQFYLIWPAVVFVAMRGRTRVAGRRFLADIALFVALASMVAMAVLMVVDGPSRAYFGTDARLHQPILGALAATMWPLGRSVRRVPPWVGAVCLAVLVAAVCLIDDQWSGYYFAVSGLVGVAAVGLLVALGQNSNLDRVLSLAPLAALGVISYGVYLWHWPILVAAQDQRITGWQLDAITVVGALGAAVVSYFLIERPIRRGGTARAPGRWRAVPAWGGLALAMGAAVGAVVIHRAPSTEGTADVAATVVSDEGIPVVALTLEPSPVISEPSVAEVASVGDDRAEPVAEAAGSVVAAKPSLPLAVLLVGDSTAWTLGGGAIGFTESHDSYTSPFDPNMVTLVNMARKGYVVTPGDLKRPDGTQPQDSRHDEYENSWVEVAGTFEPDAVMLMIGYGELFERAVFGVRVEFGSPEHLELMDTALEELMAGLSANSPLFVLTQPRFEVELMRHGTVHDFLVSVGASRLELVNERVRRAAGRLDNVEIIDLANFVCGPDECRPLDDGAPARFDGVHFTPEGANVAARWLTEQLEAALLTVD